jgi:hypothetical protein
VQKAAVKRENDNKAIYGGDNDKKDSILYSISSPLTDIRQDLKNDFVRNAALSRQREGAQGLQEMKNAQGEKHGNQFNNQFPGEKTMMNQFPDASAKVNQFNSHGGHGVLPLGAIPTPMHSAGNKRNSARSNVVKGLDDSSFELLE